MDEQNEIYYRIYNTADGWKIVTMQWFDEYDYDQSKFYTDHKFHTYEQADQFMQKHHIGEYTHGSPIKQNFTLSEFIVFLQEKEKVAGDLPVYVVSPYGPVPLTATIMDKKGGYDLTKMDIVLIHEQK